MLAAHPLSADDTELKITRSLDEIIFSGVRLNFAVKVCMVLHIICLNDWFTGYKFNGSYLSAPLYSVDRNKPVNPFEFRKIMDTK